MKKRKWLAVAAALSLGNVGMIGVAHAEDTTGDAVQPGVESNISTPAVDDAVNAAQPGTEVAVEDAAQPGTETESAPAPEVKEPETPADTPEPAVESTTDNAPSGAVQAGTEVETAPAVNETEPQVDAQPAPAPEVKEPETPADTPEPAVEQVSNDMPAVERASGTEQISTKPVVDAAEAAPVKEQPAEQETAKPRATSPEHTPKKEKKSNEKPQAEAQRAPAPERPADSEVLHTSNWGAFVKDNSITTNVETTAGLTVANTQVVVDGTTTALAPVSYGTYDNGVVELGIGTDTPEPVELDANTTLVADKLNEIEVPDLNLIPDTGDYFFGTTDAGINASWS